MVAKYKLTEKNCESQSSHAEPDTERIYVTTTVFNPAFATEIRPEMYNLNVLFLNGQKVSVLKRLVVISLLIFLNRSLLGTSFSEHIIIRL